MLQGLVRRSDEGKVLMLLSLLLGALCGTLVSRPLRSRFTEQSAINLANLQPTGAQLFMQPSTGWQRPQLIERVMPRQAMASQKEEDHFQMESPSFSRRDLLGGAAQGAVAAVALKDAPAFAAYGDYARVFASGATNPSGFVAYEGEGFSLLLPSKWNPSKEKDFEGEVLRYEDNFDAVNNLLVIKQKTDKSSVDGYGSTEEFLNAYSYLLGKQSYSGKTISEGGFAPDRVSAASVLDVQKSTDKKGRAVYKYNILSRTADGNEGGRHQLISATVAGGNLWILRIQAGDKRWFKGTKNECEGTFNSFAIAG